MTKEKEVELEFDIVVSYCEDNNGGVELNTGIQNAKGLGTEENKMFMMAFMAHIASAVKSFASDMIDDEEQMQDTGIMINGKKVFDV